jgi:hypothetical protein
VQPRSCALPAQGVRPALWLTTISKGQPLAEQSSDFPSLAAAHRARPPARGMAEGPEKGNNAPSTDSADVWSLVDASRVAIAGENGNRQRAVEEVRCQLRKELEVSRWEPLHAQQEAALALSPPHSHAIASLPPSQDLLRGRYLDMAEILHLSEGGNILDFNPGRAATINALRNWDVQQGAPWMGPIAEAALPVLNERNKKGQKAVADDLLGVSCPMVVSCAR